MAKFNPVTFMKEVRQETAKVTWPTWKEVWVTTLMVLIMVALASIFFLLVDQTLSHAVQFLLSLGH
jgi:preprotein translocase subunit SecE